MSCELNSNPLNAQPLFPEVKVTQSHSVLEKLVGFHLSFPAYTDYDWFIQARQKVMRGYTWDVSANQIERNGFPAFTQPVMNA